MVELSALSESLENGEVVLHGVPTDVQLADALSKHTASITLHNALHNPRWCMDLSLGSYYRMPRYPLTLTYMKQCSTDSIVRHVGTPNLAA